MDITRITPKNVEAFENLMPPELKDRDDLLWFGVVSDENTAIGLMAIEVDDEESVDIVWLYIVPSHREQKAATELMETVFSFLNIMGIKRAEASFTEDNEGVEMFLSDYGFMTGPDNDTYRVPVNDLIYSQPMDELLDMTGDPAKVVSAEDDEIFDRLDQLLDENGVDLKDADRLSRKLTRVAVNEEGEATGCILVRELADYDLEIAYFLNTGADKNALELIASLALELRERDIDETGLSFTDPAGHSIQLVESLTGEYRESYRVDGLYHGVYLL